MTHMIRRSSIACLLLALAFLNMSCGDSGVFNPTFGTLNLQIITEGDNLDDGYRLIVNGPDLDVDLEVAAEQQLILTVEEAGDYTVELLDIADNCSVENNPRTVFVEIGSTSKELLNSVCV